MKKILLFLAFITGLTLQSSAQITITQADFPILGNIWTEFADNRQNVHTITAAGASQTWNYANAFITSDTTILNFVSPSVTPAAGQPFFPNATHAFIEPNGIEATYLRSANDGFYIEGIYDDTASLALVFNPSDLLVPAPFTYNNTRNNTAVFSFEQPAIPPNPGFLFKSFTIQTFTADAYGSLSTPVGSYPNTLRIKLFQYSLDSTFVDLSGTGVYTFLSSSPPSDTTIDYSWWKKGAGALLMILHQDPFTLQSDGASYFQNGVVGINEPNSNHDVNVFPNPSQNGVVHFSFESTGFSEIRIFDTQGRLVYKDSFTGINQYKIGTSLYKSGLYYFELTGLGSPPERGKFLIK